MRSPERTVATAAEHMAPATYSALAMVLCHAVSAVGEASSGEHDARTDALYNPERSVLRLSNKCPVLSAMASMGLEKTQPKTLVIWGRCDPSQLAAEAAAYERDLPHAEIHVMDAGYFALDLAPDADVIAAWMRDFLRRNAL